ncbi:MAG TPA: putative PEP-binding protein, partial [Candidatus Sulfotelmatobacter sp.]|nr:putative PEP-binding protein [Candidatus Sulfotelmatobacter sp.]
RVALGANLIDPREFTAAREQADLVGLMRTEFLYVGREELPSEDEQFDTFATMTGMPVIFRTLDLGGDKMPGRSVARKMDLREDGNPLLGLRGIRACNHNDFSRDVFRTQLRAMLRAGAVNPEAAIMFPMVTKLHELRWAKDEIKAQLGVLEARRGVKFNPKMPIGVMIEVPSAVFLARAFAREADFLNFGSNDMIQYMYAMDRDNADVARLYDPFHFSLLSGIKQTINAGRAERKPVCLCGDIGADPLEATLLIGMGIDRLSMSPSEIANIKYMLTGLDYRRVKKFANRLFTEIDPLIAGDETSARAMLMRRIYEELPYPMASRVEGACANVAGRSPT